MGTDEEEMDEFTYLVDQSGRLVPIIGRKVNLIQLIKTRIVSLVSFFFSFLFLIYALADNPRREEGRISIV